MESMNELFNLLDNLNPGEVVVMKAESSSYGPEFFAILLKKYSELRGKELVIVDMLDTLHVLSEHLRIFGFKDAFSDIPVVKVGGTINIGKVIKRVGIAGEHILYVKRYREVLEDYLREKKKEIIVLVVGCERLMALLSKYNDFYQIIVEIQKSLGHENTIVIYIMDTSVTKRLPLDPLPELERIATTVVKAEPREGAGIFRVEKMPIVGIIKRTIEITTPTIMNLLLTLKQVRT
ncbi:DUF257 family protein [Pyrococcus kukulkanii]|uniref:KaiC-like domain-containing protein n=1 Tax=Pyrococcus kukulkanii TaxID=1609559 RepID=A0A127B7E2_9EURY|nr:DUF257 family protein [Pyrococcus kukulkanii]AMM53320.1 hypothetical protein TQ32_01515 [Pyrococcus kukulkanii]